MKAAPKIRPAYNKKIKIEVDVIVIVLNDPLPPQLLHRYFFLLKSYLKLFLTNSWNGIF